MLEKNQGVFLNQAVSLKQSISLNKYNKNNNNRFYQLWQKKILTAASLT